MQSPSVKTINEVTLTDRSAPPRPKIRLTSIALPIEHGSWGFLLEPLVAGAAIAPSFASIWIALIYIGPFLMRRPMKIYLSDRIAGKNLPQTEAALRFTLAYSLLLVSGIAGCYFFVPPAVLIPLAAILPLAGYQIYCDISRQTRELLPEIMGAVAMSSSAAVMTLAGGFSWQSAAAVWFLFAARLIPSILYVRDRLRLEKGKKHSFMIPVAAHLVALALIIALAALSSTLPGTLYGERLLPLLTIPIFGVLLFRAAYGLSPYRKRMKAVKIGIWEVIYGVLTVLSLIIGYHAGL